MLGVDVLSSQEEQEPEAHEIEQLDGALRLYPPEALWPYRQTEQDLEHHRRQQSSRHEPGKQRGHERHRRDD